MEAKYIEYFERAVYLERDIVLSMQGAALYAKRAKLCREEAAACTKELAMCETMMTKIMRHLDDTYLYEEWEERIQ